MTAKKKPRANPAAEPHGRCKRCRFYHYDSKNADRYGFCHKYAPRVDPSSLRYPLHGLFARWPQVKALDWCGEWEPKPSKAIVAGEDRPF